MPTTSLTLPGTVTGSGWNNPNNLKVDDSTYTDYTIDSATTNSFALIASNFGFAIPSLATITGFTIELARYQSGTTVKDQGSNPLIRNTAGSRSSNAHDAGQETFAGSREVITYTCGAGTLTPADVNETGFGVHLQVEHTTGAGSDTAYYDYLKLSVSYLENDAAPDKWNQTSDFPKKFYERKRAIQQDFFQSSREVSLFLAPTMDMWFEQPPHKLLRAKRAAEYPAQHAPNPTIIILHTPTTDELSPQFQQPPTKPPAKRRTPYYDYHQVPDPARIILNPLFLEGVHTVFNQHPISPQRTRPYQWTRDWAQTFVFTVDELATLHPLVPTLPQSRDPYPYKPPKKRANWFQPFEVIVDPWLLLKYAYAFEFTQSPTPTQLVASVKPRRPSLIPYEANPDLLPAIANNSFVGAWLPVPTSPLPPKKLRANLAQDIASFNNPFVFVSTIPQILTDQTPQLRRPLRSRPNYENTLFVQPVVPNPFVFPVETRLLRRIARQAEYPTPLVEPYIPIVPAINIDWDVKPPERPRVRRRAPDNITTTNFADLQIAYVGAWAQQPSLPQRKPRRLPEYFGFQIVIDESIPDPIVTPTDHIAGTVVIQSSLQGSLFVHSPFVAGETNYVEWIHLYTAATNAKDAAAITATIYDALGASKGTATLDYNSATNSYLGVFQSSVDLTQGDTYDIEAIAVCGSLTSLRRIKITAK